MSRRTGTNDSASRVLMARTTKRASAVIAPVKITTAAAASTIITIMATPPRSPASENTLVIEASILRPCGRRRAARVITHTFARTDVSVGSSGRTSMPGADTNMR